MLGIQVYRPSRLGCNGKAGIQRENSKATRHLTFLSLKAEVFCEQFNVTAVTCTNNMLYHIVLYD